MFKKNEGSVVVETAIIMQLCLMCILGLIGLTIKYHYTITSDLYSDINMYYSEDQLWTEHDMDQDVNVTHSTDHKEKTRIKKIQQLKFFDDISDQITISSKIKQKYANSLEKIQGLISQ